MTTLILFKSNSKRWLQTSICVAQGRPQLKLKKDGSTLREFYVDTGSVDELCMRLVSFEELQAMACDCPTHISETSQPDRYRPDKS